MDFSMSVYTSLSDQLCKPVQALSRKLAKTKPVTEEGTAGRGPALDEAAALRAERVRAPWLQLDSTRVMTYYMPVLTESIPS